MKKKIKNSDNDEIRLFEILKFLWINKIKLFSAVLIMFSISMSYFFIKKNENLYESSIVISAPENYELIKFQSINRFFESKIKNYDIVIINKLSILNRAIDELKNSKDNQKLFKIELLNNNQFILKFTFNDTKNSKSTIEKVLSIASSNLEKKLIKELNELFEETKKMIIEEDEKRLRFLLEQSSISKKIDLEFNMHKASDFDTDDKKYFLIGYKPIDEEIRIIQSRNYEELTKVKNKINSFKNMNIQWINYDTDLANTRALYKRSEQIRLYLILSITLGLIVGSIYVLTVKEEFSKKI